MSEDRVTDVIGKLPDQPYAQGGRLLEGRDGDSVTTAEATAHGDATDD
jgi:hypothetical protein